ncbi:hypothetical protein DLJ53_08145 [Acuticoccus sediminis]|uniref:Uncharacterized protein n=1 Tax=Acuticoccus sediminis TaxID=2184697 RepID=A0A8B2NW80_9HYPH|nr:hypothetical protein [Acuticoccus sediminis]RAI04397.1 hypothetical protein DLJ53_08145 [Acuticoccus sediminis]
MLTFRKLFATLALALAGALAAAPAAPLLAADLPGGAEATQFQFADKLRRGVLVREGILLVRADGCYFTNVEVVNGNPHPVTVAISYRWPGRRGRPLATITALERTTVASGEFLAVDGEGCSGTVGSYYPTLSRSTPTRIISVR